jgi:hypothetical protein
MFGAVSGCDKRFEISDEKRNSLAEYKMLIKIYEHVVTYVSELFKSSSIYLTHLRDKCYGG